MTGEGGGEIPPQPPIPRFDLSDPDGDPVTIGEFLRFIQLRGVPDDWTIQIRIAGDRVVMLGLDLEDIHFEAGKMMLVTGSDQVIHVEPLNLEILGGSDDGG